LKSWLQMIRLECLVVWNLSTAMVDILIKKIIRRWWGWEMRLRVKPQED
jgi:hypothetical protein